MKSERKEALEEIKKRIMDDKNKDINDNVFK